MRSLSKIACILSFALVITSVAGAIPWPVGTNGPDFLNSYTLMNTYGEMNNNWADVGPGLLINFHTGIDISYEDIGTENVWCIEDGVFRHCYSFMDQAQGIWEWIAVVSPNLSSDEGWCYCHVEGDDGNPIHLDTISAEDPVNLGDLLGTMTERTDKHLHFARTGPTAPFGYPGIDNPLDHLVPETLVSAGYYWVINFSAIKSTFFLEDHDALDWMTVWPDSSSVLPDTLDRNDLSGGVDLFLAFWCQGWDQIGPPPSTYVMPQKIFWELKEYDSASSSWISVFSRYVVDFDGSLGASGPDPSDWEKFKRFYFAYLGGSLLIGDSYVSCLTNCGDAEGWDGINNIEENCWQTDSDNQFSGVTTNPVLAAFPDGPYRIDVMSYAWDTTETHGDTLDIELHNFSPVVERVVISCAGRRYGRLTGQPTD